MQVPSYPWRFVHLSALWAYGVAQPVFSMLLANPEFLVINGASRLEAVMFAVVITLLPPLVVVAGEAALGLISKGVSAVFHILFVWAFGFTALLQVLTLFDPSSRWSLALPATAAYVGAMAYVRWRPVRLFLGVSAVLPLIGLVTFLTGARLAIADAEGARIAVPGETPIVFVVLDEFPTSSILRADGSVDDERYPAFGRLAREGTWYSRATTVHEYTTHALPAIVTGELPLGGALPTLADFPDNLFTLLGDAYTFRVDEPVTRLCPVSYCPEHRSGTPLASRVTGLVRDVGVNYLHGSLPREFHGDIAPLREGWGALVENMARGTFDFTESVRRSNPPRTLYFLHLHQPHSPWMLLPSGRRYGHPYFVSGLTNDWTPSKFERWRDEPLLVEQALQRHLLEVVHVDGVLQELLQRLDREGLYDRALVIVTADHGISFRAGGWKRHLTRDNAADIAAVPLFVKYPGQRAGREDRRDADTTDLVPTVADVLGIKLPWAADGRSLRSRPRSRMVRLGTRDTPLVTASHEAIAGDVLRTARRNASLFGAGADSFYRVGPRQDLLGREVERLPRVEVREATIRLSRPEELSNVRKASGYVPAHVVGRVLWHDLRQRERLAVAVNGRIAAVTTPFRANGRTYFSSLVDEALLNDGSNRVDVFAVRGRASKTVLIALGGTGADAA